MDGMSWDRYLKLSWYTRWAMHEELSDLIERTNPEDDPPPERPKRMRR